MSKQEKDDLISLLKARLFSISINLEFGREYREIKSFEWIKPEIDALEKYKSEIKKELEKVSNVVSKENCKKLLQDERSNSLLKKLRESKNKSSSFGINENLDDYNLKRIQIDEEIQDIHIVILGCRGVGKSSFINAFFGVNNFDKKRVETGETEETLYPKCYNDQFFGIENDEPSKKFENRIKIWDYPGANTDRFPVDEYIEVCNYLPVDAFIYLFKEFVEVDKKIFNEMEKNKKPLFLVKTHADAHLENENIMELINQHLDKKSDKILEDQINKNWLEYKKSCKQDKNVNETCKIYFISCSNLYREYFDFKYLISDVVKIIPNEKRNLMLINLKMKSFIFFKIKLDLLEQLFETWTLSLLVLYEQEDKRNFLRFLLSKINEIYLTFGIENDFNYISLNELDLDFNFDKEFSQKKDIQSIILESALLSVAWDRLSIFEKRLLTTKNKLLADNLNDLFKGLSKRCFDQSIQYVASV